MFGTVVFWRPDKGYGFIRQADRPDDIFFNVSEFAGDPKLIVKGGIGAWKGWAASVQNIRRFGRNAKINHLQQRAVCVPYY